MSELCPLCRSDRISKLVQRKDRRWICRCAHCSHCFIPLSEDTRWLKEIYDSYSARSIGKEEEARQTKEAWFKDPQEYFQIGLRWLKQARRLNGLRILEIGCGPGLFLAALREEGADVLGIDGSLLAVSRAKKWFGLEVQLGQIETLVPRLPKNSCDVVVMFETVEHLVDPIGVLRQINSLLVDKGLLLVSTPDFSAYWSQKTGYSDLSVRFEHIHFFELNTLAQALQKSGFNVIAHLPCGKEIPLAERVALRSGLRPVIGRIWSIVRKIPFLRALPRLAYRRANILTSSLGLDRDSTLGLFVVAEKPGAVSLPKT